MNSNHNIQPIKKNIEDIVAENENMSDNFELKLYASDEEDSIFDADDINFENDTFKYDDKTNDSYYNL